MNILWRFLLHYPSQGNQQFNMIAHNPKKEAYGKPLETVLTLKYLGQVMTAGDDNWPEVTGNLVKERKSWGRLTRILSREGADNMVSGNFFKAVVQAMLLFGAETWVLTP